MGRAATPQPEFLTTAEAARLLRLNPKKVYDLVQQGRLPAARVHGKWLFPREALHRWVESHTVHPPGGLLAALLDRVIVMQGSDDWLLTQTLDTLRTAGKHPVVAASVGSMGGARALREGDAHVAGFHVPEADLHPFLDASSSWYVLTLGQREQGLMFPRTLAGKVQALRSVVDLGLRWADRQPGSGTYRLARGILAQEGCDPARLTSGETYASHLDVAAAVHAGHADVGMGIRVAAELFGLGFLPVASEPFALALPTPFAAHPRMAAFLGDVLEELNRARRRHAPGYHLGDLGKIHTLRHHGATTEG
jgi:excisionase family DNA binding protein